MSESLRSRIFARMAASRAEKGMKNSILDDSPVAFPSSLDGPLAPASAVKKRKRQQRRSPSQVTASPPPRPTPRKRKSPPRRPARPIVPFVKGFVPPTAQEREDALLCPGTARRPFPLPHTIRQEEQRFFEWDPLSFPPIPACTSIDDWLAQYEEEAQTVSDYLRFVCMRSGQFKPGANAKCNTIYLLPIGNELSKRGPVSMRKLLVYTRAYYLGCNVVLLPPIEVQQEGEALYWQEMDNKWRYELKGRVDPASGRRQLRVDPILTLLSSMKRSKTWAAAHPDAFCIMGLTMEDLYDDDPDLFVAGMAAGGSKVAVFSFCRYDPRYRFSCEFWHQWHLAEPRQKRGRKKGKNSKKRAAVAPALSARNKQVLLKRCCKLLVHELGHLFGIGHCVFSECCMNGSGHLEEDYRQPMHLCPVELKKLRLRLGPQFDLMQRMQALHNFYSKEGAEFAQEAAWLEGRLGVIQVEADAETMYSN